MGVTQGALVSSRESTVAQNSDRGHGVNLWGRKFKGRYQAIDNLRSRQSSGKVIRAHKYSTFLCCVCVLIIQHQ